jgi:hypothetical protein
MNTFYDHINNPVVKSEFEKAVSKYRRYYREKFYPKDTSFVEAEEYSIKLSRVRAEIDFIELYYDFSDELGA